MRIFTYLLLLLVVGLSPASARADAQLHFERPQELERDIAFWRRVYTEVSTQGGFIHDPERLDVVYEVIEFPAGVSARQRSKLIDDTKRKYTKILERLASGAENLTEEESR